MSNIIVQLSLVFVLHCIGSSSSEKIIINADPGIDDAMGILMLLRSEFVQKQYQVIAITCSYGNTKSENAEMNALKILTIAERTDIPVYAGAKKPIIENFVSDNFFGIDGLGDVPFIQPITAKVNTSMIAPVALVELTKKYKGDVIIISIGPTTNLALAELLDPDFTSRVKSFYTMGGCVAGVGLYKPNVEFNFGADPESDFVLLNKTSSKQLTLLPWETVINAKMPKDWYQTVLNNYTGRIIDFVKSILRIVLKKEGDYTPADSMVVVALLQPDIVTSSLETNVQPVIDGAAKGSLLVDYSNYYNGKLNNARILMSVDPEKFRKAIIFYLTCESIKC